MPSFAISSPAIASLVTPGSPDYDDLLAKSQVANYYKKTGANKAEAGLINAGLNAFGMAKKGDLQAEGMLEAAAAQADAARSNAMWGLAGDIGGGLISGFGKMDFGGGDSGGISFSDGMNLGLPSYGDYGGMSLEGFGAFG